MHVFAHIGTGCVERFTDPTFNFVFRELREKNGKQVLNVARKGVRKEDLEKLATHAANTIAMQDKSAQRCADTKLERETADIVVAHIEHRERWQRGNPTRQLRDFVLTKIQDAKTAKALPVPYGTEFRNTIHTQMELGEL